MKSLFLLVGNAPYTNRGCEAIVRGTMRILRHEFGENARAVVASFFTSYRQYLTQRAQETDPGIEHVRLELPERFKWGWWLRQVDKVLGTSLALSSRTVKRYTALADATLQIGGDNYTLDYGYPVAFMEIDRRVLALGRPLVLWGASVGPFDTDPRFQKRIADHLAQFDAILVREGRSDDILRRMGIEKNVSRTVDPAFVMDPVRPEAGKLGFDVPDGAVGLNLSPLMANYVTGSDLRKWIGTGAGILSAVLRTVERPIILVPHVTSDNPAVDDGALLREIRDALSETEKRRVCLAGESLSAAETKWLISKCAVFAGSRTHSTIAAISSGVPTLCFAYSTKARGLSELVYGSTDYCLEPQELTPEGVSTAVARLCANADAVRDHLRAVLPGLFEQCYYAGRVLRQAISRAFDA